MYAANSGKSKSKRYDNPELGRSMRPSVETLHGAPKS